MSSIIDNNILNVFNVNKEINYQMHILFHSKCIIYSAFFFFLTILLSSGYRKLESSFSGMNKAINVPLMLFKLLKFCSWIHILLAVITERLLNKLYRHVDLDMLN